MLYICTHKDKIMLEIIRNIISFIGTFLIISSVSILVMKFGVYFYSHNYDFKYTDVRIIVVGVVVALILIPFYHFPC